MTDDTSPPAIDEPKEWVQRGQGRHARPPPTPLAVCRPECAAREANCCNRHRKTSFFDGSNAPALIGTLGKVRDLQDNQEAYGLMPPKSTGPRSSCSRLRASGSRRRSGRFRSARTGSGTCFCGCSASARPSSSTTPCSAMPRARRRSWLPLNKCGMINKMSRRAMKRSSRSNRPVRTKKKRLCPGCKK